MTAVTKERKPRTKKEKRAMPVSEKFYMDMMMRINSVLPSPENREVIVMMCKHINGIPFNPDDFGALSEVAYMLLLPEIDRAMARSRAARERARKNMPSPKMKTSPMHKGASHRRQNTMMLMLTEFLP